MRAVRTRIRNPAHQREQLDSWQQKKIEQSIIVSVDNRGFWLQTHQEDRGHCSCYKLLSKTAAFPRYGRFIATKDIHTTINNYYIQKMMGVRLIQNSMDLIT